MPKAAAAPLPAWGKPKNNVKIGLVGLPNVGKSSTFNLLGELQVAAENYPFCTIEPSKTSVGVPDVRFTNLCEFWKPKSEVQAVLNVTDIAGLVKGASEGKGLGNEFLSNISQVDAIFHVCRAFLDKQIEHVEGEVDPTRDFAIITGELMAKDLEMITNKLEARRKETRSKCSKEEKFEIEVYAKARSVLDPEDDTYTKEAQEIRKFTWSAQEILILNPLNFLTTKPVVYLINISEKNFLKQQNKWFKAIKTWLKENSPTDALIPYSVKFEEKIKDMEPAARKEYLDECKVQSMLPKIIKTGYKALGLINFFTCGADEVRAWTVRKGSLAPQAAGVIHTDFEKNFVKAKVYNYDAFKEHGSEADVKKAGKYGEKGKTYEVADGDIMFFLCGK